jgi:hypothetical protein
MTISNGARSALVVALAAMAFGGCAIGTTYVSAPPRLPSYTLPSLTRPIRFDVCVTYPQFDRPPHEAARRATVGRRVRTLLSHAGVPAELTLLAGSPVDFTVTVSDQLGWMGSAVISITTLAVVPGYFVERKTLDVDLAWRDEAEVAKTEHLQYQARAHRFIWLPLVLSPDFVWPGGWESRRSSDGGFKPMVERLADDIRVRRGRDDAETPIRPSRYVACPVPGGATASPRMALQM